MRAISERFVYNVVKFDTGSSNKAVRRKLPVCTVFGKQPASP